MAVVASSPVANYSHELPPNRCRRYPRGTSRKRHQSCSTRASALIARRRHAECGTYGLLPPPKSPPDGRRRAILEWLPDAQTRHNRNFQPSANPSYCRIGTLASSLRVSWGAFTGASEPGAPFGLAGRDMRPSCSREPPNDRHGRDPFSAPRFPQWLGVSRYGAAEAAPVRPNQRPHPFK